MATHLRMISGETLSVEGEFGEIAAQLGAEQRLVALAGSFGGTFYVNPSQVVYMEQSPEVGAGAAAVQAGPEAGNAPAAPSGPSQPPPV